MATNRLCAIVDCGNEAHAQYWCRDHYNRWKRWGHPLIRPPLRTPNGVPWTYLQTVVLTFQGDECLLWPYGATNGYGTITRNKGRYRVNRFVCEAHHGSPPTPRHEAAHSCGNRRCCNPQHLRWATPEENSADKVLHGTHNRGERSTKAIITTQDALEIRAFKGKRGLRELSERFGIGINQIKAIQNNKSWAWL